MICYVPKPGYMWNPLENFPRNAPCFCGSDKKFKRCHMTIISRTVSVEEYKKLEPYIPAIYAGKLRVTRKEDPKNETSIDNASPEPKHSGNDQETLVTDSTPGAGESPDFYAHFPELPAELKSDGVESTNS